MDEADATALPPFRDEVEAVLDALPRTCRLVLASATVSALLGGDADFDRDAATEVVDRARSAVVLDAGRASGSVASRALAPTARHGRLRVDSTAPFAKVDALRRVLRADEPRCDAALVFVDDGDAALALATKLQNAGVDALVLAGAVSGDDRARAVAHLAEAPPPAVVVATEVAARGLDAPRVTHVVNAQGLPSSPAHYAHRAGRCGRDARTPAFVVSIVTNRETRVLDKLASDLDITIHDLKAEFGALFLCDDDATDEPPTQRDPRPT